MAQRDRPAVDVDSLVVKPQFPVDRERDRREGFINLEQIDVADGEAGLFEHKLDCLDRRDRKPFRRQRRSGIADDTRHRREPAMRSFLFSHHNHRCRSVVARGRIAHGENAVFLEHRLEFAQLAQIDPVRLLIVRDAQGCGLPLRDVNRHDFPLEGTSRHGFPGTAVTFQREVIQLTPGEPVLGGTELAAVAHVKLVIDIPQTVFDQTIHQLRMAQPIPLPRLLQ